MTNDFTSKQPERISEERLVPLNTTGAWPLLHNDVGRGDINVSAEKPQRDRLFGTRIREAIRTLTS